LEKEEEKGQEGREKWKKYKAAFPPSFSAHLSILQAEKCLHSYG
jgi:hypothetical protein